MIPLEEIGAAGALLHERAANVPVLALVVGDEVDGRLIVLLEEVVFLGERRHRPAELVQDLVVDRLVKRCLGAVELSHETERNLGILCDVAHRGAFEAALREQVHGRLYDCEPCVPSASLGSFGSGHCWRPFIRVMG